MLKLYSYTKLFYSEIALGRIVNTDAGILWIILPQFIQIIIYFLIFSVGFRTSSISDIPFIVYMLPAFLAWSLFSDSLISSSSLLNQYQYMITKFPTPFYLLISSYYLYALSVFIVLSSAFYLLSSIFVQYHASLWSILYFILVFAVFSVFTFSVSLLISIFSFISKDVQNAVTIIINSLFWLSPVVYPAALLSDFNPTFKFIIFKVYPVNLLIDALRHFSSSSLYMDTNFISILPASLLSLSLFIFSILCYKRTRFFLAEFI